MQLDPFVRVDAIPFSAAPQDILNRHGAPRRALRNEVGLNEFDYGAVVFRFQDSGRLEEITLQVPVLGLQTLRVPFVALAGFVREQDDRCFERAGFLVSPRYGLAFDPEDPCWVTALARHALPAWRAL